MSCEPKGIKPDGHISKEIAEEREQNYVNNIYGKELNYQDNREFWFSNEELQKMIDYAAHVGDSLDLTTTGLRAYLGAQMDENGNWKTELFFVPTVEGEDLNDNYNDSGAFNDSQSGMPPISFIKP
jgi:hypothetical protein